MPPEDERATTIFNTQRKFDEVRPCCIALSLHREVIKWISEYLVYRATPCCSAILAPCLSVTSLCSIETSEQIELVLTYWLPWVFYNIVLEGNSGICKNKSRPTSLSTCLLGTSTVACKCYQLSSTDNRRCFVTLSVRPPLCTTQRT